MLEVIMMAADWNIQTSIGEKDMGQKLEDLALRYRHGDGQSYIVDTTPCYRPFTILTTGNVFFLVENVREGEKIWRHYETINIHTQYKGKCNQPMPQILNC